ncbi:hypothetical protein JGUZn3_10130 [Entomobacter blattae]|uniref:Uncharacterized protein n=1 Tax=Entomobacter blattae TaxID=2762277 RepID=A0A7H1NR32_9PROT|nr:hypothetical protein JGUZn3_10130 [Entomobacter blattae]
MEKYKKALETTCYQFLWITFVEKTENYFIYGDIFCP